MFKLNFLQFDQCPAWGHHFQSTDSTALLIYKVHLPPGCSPQSFIKATLKEVLVSRHLPAGEKDSHTF